jgi:hypothetical protein
MENQSASQPEYTVVSFYTFDGYKVDLQRFNTLYEPEHLAFCPGEQWLGSSSPSASEYVDSAGYASLTPAYYDGSLTNALALMGVS